MLLQKAQTGKIRPFQDNLRFIFDEGSGGNHFPQRGRGQNPRYGHNSNRRMPQGFLHFYI